LTILNKNSHRPSTRSLDGIEGSVESWNSCWSVNISAIAHVVRKLGNAGREAAHTKKKQRKCTFFGRISPNDVSYSYFEGPY
jgi:hypothetical protein